MSLVPLEFNPEVMTQMLHKLGVPKKWNMVDVYGLDPDSLAILMKPVLAMILLYPQTDEEAAENSKHPDTNVSPNIYFLKQFLSNACGTIALIHSVANNLDAIELQDGFLKFFFENTKNLSSVERGELLLKAEDLIEIHKELSQEGQSTVPSEDEPVLHHFVAFVQKDGHIYELDGRKTSPVNHGNSAPASFLENVARVCQEYMQRDPNEIRYTMVALVPAE
ncbi:ubiquitin carboxyl-terminal hydrolase-like isoform X2 [Belonocnema kinseyi]|uniref:ubiquitin carboxyl-terminal hydrolase-like isoform X2 n=1 Tax=Belonocnema kinseyi TaxID=2817044 RepID=UPI00143CFB47|nr:ubiquitin carboxyl-terminal hydrolase-like isoform X2 [Belonocnema kinseyi]